MFHFLFSKTPVPINYEQLSGSGVRLFSDALPGRLDSGNVTKLRMSVEKDGNLSPMTVMVRYFVSDKV